jgi:hypothetical protein
MPAPANGKRRTSEIDSDFTNMTRRIDPEIFLSASGVAMHGMLPPRFVRRVIESGDLPPLGFYGSNMVPVFATPSVLQAVELYRAEQARIHREKTDHL